MDNQKNQPQRQGMIHEWQVSNGFVTGQMLAATTTIAKGDIYYIGADGKFARLPIGTVGQTLKVSAAGLPYWG